MLPDELARAVQARVLPRAPEQTLAQLKAALARAVIAVDPDGAEQRHREARRDRRVVVTAEPDGMGSLWALLTATDAAGAFTWLTRLARGLGADDPRIDGRPPRRPPRRPAQRPPALGTDTDHRHRRRADDARPATAMPSAARPASGAPDCTGGGADRADRADRTSATRRRAGRGRSSRSPPANR